LTEPHTLVDNVLDQVAEHTIDHQQILADFSSRLEPFANDLIDVWTKAYRETAALVPLSAETIAHGAQDDFVRAFFGELKRGNPRQAFLNLAAWSRALAYEGMSFDLALRLLREYQRALLDFVLRAYADDPLMPLVFDAFDDLFDGAVTTVGAVYIEVIEKSRSHTIGLPDETVQARLMDAGSQQALGQLTGGMTHALNSLFATLLGRTQLLLERTQDYEIHDELEEIQNAAATGARVIRRIQDYALNRSLEKQSVDVNMLLRDAAEVTRFVWRDQAESRGIFVDVVKDFADVPPVLADPAELRKAFVAILMNAIEAMPTGGLITLRTERKGSNVLVSITDNGEGMPIANRARAFDPFFTTKESPHLGLGLSNAAKIIDDHTGKIVIDSKPQNGTSVTVSLPIVQGVTPQKGKQPMPPARAANILVIDNDPTVRTLLMRLLKMQGHNVVAAESGSEGISAFKAKSFDVVFTDLGMPEMSGWDVAREIKALNPRVLVALTTGWPIEMTPEELKEKHVDRVVAKPFDLPVLFSMAEEAVLLNESK
jgi:signal transduction histidine kinase